MSQSLSKLYVHLIFHIKNGCPVIRVEDEDELYSYIGGVIKDNDSLPIKINGTGNHVHILATMSKNISLSKLTEEIKRNSSRWIKNKGKYYDLFAWQSGYAGYSVSQSKVDIVKRYIADQKEHHKAVTFKDEYVKFLREYNVEFDEEYLWT